MKWLKSLVMISLMTVVAYGLYRSLTKGPSQDPVADGPAPAWQNQDPTAITVDLGPQVEAPKAEHVETSAAMPQIEEPVLPPPLTGVAEAEARVASPLPSAPVKTGVAEINEPTGPAMPSMSPGLNPPGVTQQASMNSPAPTYYVNQPEVTAPANQQLPVPGSPAGIEQEFAAELGRVNDLLSHQRFGEALMELSPWYSRRGQLSENLRTQLLDELDMLAGKVIYSRDHLLEQPHVVAPAETLEQIGQRYRVPWRLLAKINGIADPNSIRAGDPLKVVSGPFHAEIELSKFELTLFLNDGRYAGRFSIGVGREVHIKDGGYTVTQKMVNPPYRDIAGGAPDNPLGARLIEFGNSYAIHGTNQPQSVGQPCDAGCIRMTPGDVDDVYDILTPGPQGSRIVVRP